MNYLDGVSEMDLIITIFLWWIALVWGMAILGWIFGWNK